MRHLVLLFAAALLCGCRCASVDRHLKLLDVDNSIETKVSPTKLSTTSASLTRRFLSLSRLRLREVAGRVLPLTCVAMGSPAPTIRWFKNDEPIYEHDSESNEILENNPSSLGRVSSTLLVTHSHAEGTDVYSCLASSGNKVARSSTIIHTSGKPSEPTERSKLLPLEPYILVTYKAFVDTIGNSVTLPCKTRGHPRPHVVWRDNNGLVVTKNPRMKVLRSGALVVSALRWSDMGEFSCTATNAFGSATAFTFLYPAAG